MLGCVPYMHDLGLPHEDSVEFKNAFVDNRVVDDASVEIALIDLPHISNLTDFDAFSVEPDVHIRIVRSCKDLHLPDVVILPGTKNTRSDMEYLRASGVAEQIKRLAHDGTTEIIGICGGFQMLGSIIRDPYRIESDREEIPGLNLLDEMMSSFHINR